MRYCPLRGLDYASCCVLFPLFDCYFLYSVFPIEMMDTRFSFCHCAVAIRCVGWRHAEKEHPASDAAAWMWLIVCPDNLLWRVRCETTKICRRRPLRGYVIIVVFPGEKAKNIFPFPRKSDVFYEYSV